METKITHYSSLNKEGVTLHFDKKISMNGHLKTDKWWVSWDKIAKALTNKQD